MGKCCGDQVRFSTINLRDFCRQLGLTGLLQIKEIGNDPAITKAFEKYVRRALTTWTLLGVNTALTHSVRFFILA